MGQFQSNTPPKKTEEQIKLDMKRKWDNFGSTQSSKNNHEEENKQNSDINNNISQPIEEIKENENKEIKRPVFLSLKPQEEQKNEIENSEENENENFKKEEEKVNQNKINVDVGINEEKKIELSNIEGKNTDNITEEKKNNSYLNEEINNNNNNEFDKEKNNEVKENEDNIDENQVKKEEAKPVKKDIDYENITLEKVFHITLSEENPKKYLFLDFYLAKLLSMEQSPSFKLDNLDDIILTVINDPSIKPNLLNYLLDCFHRAYEIIEIRFKDILGPNFAQIHLAIATYFGQVVSSPESFELNVTKKQISEIIKSY